MDRTTKEIIGTLLYSLGSISLFCGPFLGLALTPYVMARSGIAASIFSQSISHPFAVGATLIVLGVLLSYTLRRVYVGR